MVRDVEGGGGRREQVGEGKQEIVFLLTNINVHTVLVLVFFFLLFFSLCRGCAFTGGVTRLRDVTFPRWHLVNRLLRKVCSMCRNRGSGGREGPPQFVEGQSCSVGQLST